MTERAATVPPAAESGATPPDPARSRRGAWTRVTLFGGALLVAAVVAWFVRLPEIPLCTFKIATGHPCPGCGMTRSITSLARGDLLASLRLHPLGIVLAGGAALGFLGGVWGLVRGRDPCWRLLQRHGTLIAVGIIGGLIALWIVRGFVVPEWSPDPVGEGRGWGALLRALR